MKAQQFDRYRVEFFNENNSVHKIGIPASRGRFHVLKITRTELNHIPGVTHARIRNLVGKETTLYALDGWLKSHLKAFKL